MIFNRKVFNPTVKLDTIKQHRLTIEGYECPQCGNKNLKVENLQEGKKGWQAQIKCTRCRSTMTLNDTGFNINLQDGTKP